MDSSRWVRHGVAMVTRRLSVALVLAVPLLLPAAPAHAGSAPVWEPVPVPTTQGFRGLAALDAETAWVSGSGGGVWRTADGGQTWQDVSPAGAAGAAFRDIEVHDPHRASVLSIGEGAASRIYTTDDGGGSWQLSFVNDDPYAFYDCMDFFPGGRRGLAMSDPVAGRFRILATDDGGHTWRVLPTDGMPPAVEGEFGFAASGTCLVTAGAHDVWFATGGVASRIFHSGDGGRTWTATTAPLPAGATAGVYSLAFRDTLHGVAVGGDFLAPESGVVTGITRNGETWQSGGIPHGYRSGVAWHREQSNTLVAVGPTGSDLSVDGGRSWTRFDSVRYDAVACTGDGACWASGPGGRVALLRV
ncbi:MAG TPA: oxidoreductase [Micromonosporaceae bacterium]|nr:oxidoreductase [Micromonosporaceae bacterium]